MDLTDDELYEVYTLVYEELYYGDDEVVYGTTAEGAVVNGRLLSTLEKVVNEAKVRKLWWA